MIANERSFDRLFCDVICYDRICTYYNMSFSDDPIFNHIVLDDSLSSVEYSDFAYDQVLSDSVLAATQLKIPVSIFVDKFHSWAERFEQIAIDREFRIGERMNVFSKVVAETLPTVSDFVKIVITKDFELWNDIFIQSYGIPDSWKEGLLTRERAFLDDPRTTLILAEEPEVEVEVSGCLLLHLEPKDWMGVYCVGTLQERRHKGIARRMMLAAEKIAYEKGCRFLTLQTVVGDGVTPMYQQIGYRIEFERDILQHT